MTTDHPSVMQVTGRLRELGAQGEVISLPTPARTAAQAAEQLECPVGAIANSLIFDAEGKPVLGHDQRVAPRGRRTDWQPARSTSQQSGR